MLKHELRKLREQDIQKVQERNKRLSSIKGNSLLEKQESSFNAIKSAKLESDLNSKKIIDNDIKDLRNKDTLDKTLISIKKSIEPSENRNKMLSTRNFKISITESLFKKPPEDS